MQGSEVTERASRVRPSRQGLRCLQTTVLHTGQRADIVLWGDDINWSMSPRFRREMNSKAARSFTVQVVDQSTVFFPN